MATQEKILTTDWQEITALGFVGQCPQTKTMQITNADSTPDAAAIPHRITDTVNLQFSAPAFGSWYARVTEVNPDIETLLIFTEI